MFFLDFQKTCSGLNIPGNIQKPWWKPCECNVDNEHVKSHHFRIMSQNDELTLKWIILTGANTVKYNTNDIIGAGGAIHMTHGSVFFIHSQAIHNVARYGGFIYMIDNMSKITINNSIINNTATIDGNDFFIQSNDTPYIEYLN